jgi:hypothetical protein
VAGQLLGEEARDGHRAPLVVLGGADDNLAMNFSDRLDDLEPAPHEIDPPHRGRSARSKISWELR